MPDYISDSESSSSSNGSEEKYFSNMDVLSRVPYLFIYEGICFAIIQCIGAYLLSDYTNRDDEKDAYSFSSSSKEIIYFDEKSHKNSYLVENQFVSNRHNVKLYNNSVKNVPADSHGHGYVHGHVHGHIHKNASLPSSASSASASVSTSFASSSILACREGTNIYMNKKFILIWLMLFFNWQAAYYIHVFWKIFGLNYLYIDDRSLSMLGGVAFLCNIIGRFFWGYLNDKTNFRVALIAMSLSMSILIVTLTLSGIYGLKTYALWVCLIFFCHAGIFAIFPVIVYHTFGSKRFGPVYGFLFTARAFSSIVNALISSVLFNSVGNILICAIVSLCSFISIMLVIVF